MSDFRKLQEIYESYEGLSKDTAPNSKYGVGQVYKHSYRGELPFNSGGDDNLYARMAANSPGIMPIENEEENITGDIEKRRVIDKIHELQNQAARDSFEYTVYTLAELVKFIKQA